MIPVTGEPEDDDELIALRIFHDTIEALFLAGGPTREQVSAALEEAGQ